MDIKIFAIYYADKDITNPEKFGDHKNGKDPVTYFFPFFMSQQEY